MENQIGLSKDYATGIVGKLNTLLCDVQIMYMNVRGFHWNIKGMQFFMLHAKFEELYDELNEMADEIAERILMLEGKPIHAFSKYLQQGNLKEIENLNTAEGTVREVVSGLKHLLKIERDIVAEASEAGDDGTVNMIGDFIDSQEKKIWMYGALSV